LAADPTEARDRAVMERKIAAIHRKSTNTSTPTPHYWICP
jgi:hypothetical protein